jgi:hypothetical protein
MSSHLNPSRRSIFCWFFVLLLATARVGGENAALPALAEKYCTVCHLPPLPDVMTRENWTQVFGFMSVWIREKNLPFEQAEYTALLNDYLAVSPASFPPIPPPVDSPGLEFRKEGIGSAPTSARPVITGLFPADLDGDGREEILVGDNDAGRISRLFYKDDVWHEETVFEVAAPSRVVVLDYDGDGLNDLAVGSYGDIHPSDSLIGSVWLLRNRGDGTYDPQPLLVDCARVSDLRAGDFNGDGKVDLLVIQFGWRTSGGLLWLEQVSPTSFVRHEVAVVNGPLQTEVLDYDGDGALDFVVLFSQEHESLVLFRNLGGGKGFENRILAQGPHPAFGSSGFSAADLDRDGDTDFLWTNGDMMDEIPLAKPYHGLRWLENRGGDLVPHDLLRMPGCYRAVAHDLDGDGDLDMHDFPSLVWLENDGKQGFTARPLLDSPSNLASLVAGDFDGDGRPDLVVGGMHVPGPLGRVGRITGLLGLKPTGPDEVPPSVR